MPFFKDPGRCPKILDYTLHVNLYKELETWCIATTLSSCCILGPTIIPMKLLIKNSLYFPMPHLGWFTIFSSAALTLVQRIFQCCTWIGSPYFPMLNLVWFTVFSNAALGLVHRIFQCCTWVSSLYFPMLHLGWFTVFSGIHWSSITFNDSQQLWIIYSLPSKFLLLNMSSPGLKKRQKTKKL